MNINLESFWSHNLQLAFDCLNAWPITCYVSVQVQKFSVSVQHLNLYLSKINLKRTPVKNLLISQFQPNFLEFPAPRTPNPLSPEHLSLKNHCSEVPRPSEVWIQVLEGPQIICIPFPKGSPQVSR